MNGGNALAERLMKCFKQTASTVKGMADEVSRGQTPPAAQMEAALKALFAAVKDCAVSLRNGHVEAADLDGHGLLKADVLETWDSLSEVHLPVSLALLMARFKSQQEGAGTSDTALHYGRVTKHSTSTDTAEPPVLLLMAGFSVEQLVLCIAFHYAVGGVRRVVPFAGAIPGGGTSWGSAALEKVLSGLQTLRIPVASTSAATPGVGLTIEHPVAVEASNPARVFQQILQWSRTAANSQCRCALDVTGGQKPMDSGASYAAMYLGWPAYYLDFTDYDPQLRRPKPQSLHYAQLQLPNSAFSLDTRKLIVELFERCRFGRALQYVDDLERFASQSAFFDEEDCADIRSAKSLIALSDAWLRADYFDDAMSECSDAICQYFRSTPPGQGETAPTGETSAREGKGGLKESDLRERICGLMNAPNAESPQTALLDYAVDEYWRITSLYEAGQDCRECLVATHGLCEVLMDGILQIRRFALRIDRIFGAVVYPPKEGSPAVLDCTGSETLCGNSVPTWRLPPAASGEKRKLLLTGAGKFDLRVPYDQAAPEIPDLASISQALASLGEVREGFVELGTRLTFAEFSGPLVVKSSSHEKLSCNQRDNNWGTFQWYDLRNLTAHWRAPLGADFHETLSRALQIWLPRYVGLYAWAVAGPPPKSTCPDDRCLEKGLECIGDGSNRPWHGKTAELRNWLRVPE